MMNKIMEKVKNVGKKVVKSRKVLLGAFGGALAYANVTICYATATAESNKIVSGITTLKTLMFAIIGGVGLIILGKNIAEFAQAYQQTDSSGMNTALKGIVGGAMMACISTVITILGF